MKYMRKIINRSNLIFIGVVILGIVLGLILLAWLNPFKYFMAKKDNTWVISQGLANTLSKQSQLKNAIDASGSVSLLDIVKIATSSGVPKQEVVKKGNEIFLSTGPVGEVKTDLVYGRYKVAVIPVPGVDFVGVPAEVDIKQPISEIKLGLTEGTGKVKGIQNVLGDKPKSNDLSKLVVSLYWDQNKNGGKDEGEPKVLWAGVTIKLTKQ